MVDKPKSAHGRFSTVRNAAQTPNQPPSTVGHSADLHKTKVRQSQFTSLQSQHKSKGSEDPAPLKKNATVQGHLTRESFDHQRSSINQRSEGQQSNDIRTATSKMLGGAHSSTHGNELVNQTGTGTAGEQMSMDEESHHSVAWADQDPLVKFGVDMSELSD